jgi:hypothetical protein
MKLLTHNKDCEHPLVPVEPEVITIDKSNTTVVSHPQCEAVYDLYCRGTGTSKDSKGKYVDVFA